MLKAFAKKVISFYKIIKYRNKNRINISSIILGKCFFEGDNRIGSYNYLRDVSVGRQSNMGDGNLFVKTRIGRFCSLGSNIRLIYSSHPISCVSTHHLFYKSSYHKCSLNNRFFYNDTITNEKGLCLEIGNDVWIGDNVLLKGGITLGDGCVIGMGAVVTKDVPSYAVVGGNPARIIKYRFDDETIKLLLNTGWWNLSMEEINKIAPYFNTPEMLFEHLYNERRIQK